MRSPAASSAFPAAAAVCLAVPGVGATLMNGTLTTYASVSSSLLDGQCDFAGVPVNSTTDPMLANYLRDGMHCAIGDELPAFGNGERCGGCYRVRSTKNCGMDGDWEVCGTMSEAVVMVSTGGIIGPGRFDCFPEAFEAITGAVSGEFSIEFEEAECTAIQTTPSVVQYSDPNPYFCKVMFENMGGWGTLDSVEGCLGDSESGSAGCTKMRRLSGQAWTDCPQGTSNKIRFHLSQVDPLGEESQIECVCKGAWPWALGDSCACGANFGGITTAPSTTSTSTITTTTVGGGEQHGGSNEGKDSGDGSSGNNDNTVVLSGSVSKTIAFTFAIVPFAMHA